MSCSNQIGRCQTSEAFMKGVEDYITNLETLNPSNIKAFSLFLDCNEDYINKIQKDTANKIDSIVKNAASIEEGNSQLSQTLRKIEGLIIDSGTKHNNVMPTEDELRKVSGDLFRLHAFLYSRLGGNRGIHKAIKMLRHDRFTGESKLKDFLKVSLGKLPKINHKVIRKDPLLSMIVLILNNNPKEDYLREVAAAAYIKQYPEDTLFEKGYVYLKTPDVLVAHLLISSNQWTCANPANKDFYPEQMAGTFHGTIAFDKGDIILPEELVLIQKAEGENHNYPIITSLEKKEGYYEVVKWCSTPTIVATNSRIDDLYIARRIKQQNKLLGGVIECLQKTSAIVQSVYDLSGYKTSVVAIIGTNGVGKSKYIEQKFAGKEAVTVFSLDMLNGILMGRKSRRQDHHFEAMMMTSAFLKKISEVPALITETVAIDQFRFNRLINRDFASRDRIVIEEIAPESVDDEFQRLVAIKGDSITRTGLDDALRFRPERVDIAKINPKIDYRLYCNATDSSGGVVYNLIANVKDGSISIIDKDKKAIYNTLVPWMKTRTLFTVSLSQQE